MNRMSIRRPLRAAVMVLSALVLSGCGALLTPQYRIHRAEGEIRAGEWQRAALDLHAALQKEPGNATAWLALARLDLLAGDSNGAEASLGHAIHAGARGEAVNILQARVWLATGHEKTLLSALHENKLQLPEPQRTVLMARALVQSGQDANAVAMLSPLLASHANLTEAREIYAEALMQQGKLGAGLQQLRTASRLDPKSPEPKLLEGNLDESVGRFAAAERALTGALKRMTPTEPLLHRVSALIGLTESRLALGEVAAAARSQAKLAALEPNAPETMLLAARIKLAHRDLSGGVNELERVVNDAPKFVQARMLLGAALLQRGDLEQAQEQLQDVVNRSPENIEARKLLAEVRLKLGEPQGALSVLTPALGAPQLNPQLLTLYSQAAQRAGNGHALEQALKRIVRKQPNNEAAKLNLAAVYLLSGEASQALSLLEQTHDTADVRRDRLLIAALAAARGQSAASGAVEQLVRVQPRNPAVLNLAASYYAAQSQLARARSLLRQALKVDANDLGSQIDLARIAQAMGDSSAAVDRLHGVLAAHPQALPVRLELAALLLSQRQFGEARSVLKAAGPHGGLAIQFALAQVALAQGDLQQAEKRLDRAIATQPANAVLSENAGLMLMQANEYSAALARFAHAARLAPNDAVYWFNAARAQLALNQPLAAHASLEKAERAQPNWLPAVSALALLDAQQGKGEAALTRVDALMKAEPNNASVLGLKGMVDARLGDLAAAVKDFSAAQRLRPSALLAEQLYEVELKAHAAHPQQPLEQWLAREPKDWQVREALGDYDLLVRKALPLAVREYRQVLAVNPHAVLALNNLAWALGRLGSPQAPAVAEQAYQLAPNSPSINDTLGWILAQRGRSTQALPYLKRATQLDPRDPELQYHYAFALAHTGARAQARTVLKKILGAATPFAAREAAERLLKTLEKS